MKRKNDVSCLLMLCLLILALSSCQQHTTKKAKQQKAPSAALPQDPAKEEDNAVDKIMALPEMKKASDEIEKGSKGKNHLTAYVETEPTAAKPYYWVKVGEDNGGSIVAEYMFTVNSKTREIKYYDMAQDTLLTLAEWRKDKAANQ